MSRTEHQTQPLVSLPTSLREQIDRAQNLLAQSEVAEEHGDREVAMIRAREGLRVLQELAAHSPDHTAMLVATQQGYKGFELETLERIDSHQIVERKFLGLTIATDVVNLPTIKRTYKRMRVI